MPGLLGLTGAANPVPNVTKQMCTALLTHARPQGPAACAFNMHACTKRLACAKPANNQGLI